MRPAVATIALCFLGAAIVRGDLAWSADDAHSTDAKDAHAAGGEHGEEVGDGKEAKTEPDECYLALVETEPPGPVVDDTVTPGEHGENGDGHGASDADASHSDVTHSTTVIRKYAELDAKAHAQTHSGQAGGAASELPPIEEMPAEIGPDTPPMGSRYPPAKNLEHVPDSAHSESPEKPAGHTVDDARSEHSDAGHDAAPAMDTPAADAPSPGDKVEVHAPEPETNPPPADQHTEPRPTEDARGPVTKPDAHASSPAEKAPHSDQHAESGAPQSAEFEEPYELIRTLELVQDRIATGSKEAHASQRELITQIAKKLMLVPDAAWKRPRNSRAAIIFALSGGTPKVLEKLLNLSPIPCVEDALLKGLLAYSQGLNDAAKSWLQEIDPRSLDSRAAAHLALAQAMLIAADSPSKAMHDLDLVRLLAPGTLLEEAALRRQAVIAALIEEFKTFEILSSQYLRRYWDSVYAKEFISRLAVAVSTAKYATDISHFQSFTGMLDSLQEERRRDVYLAVAQAAVVRGKTELARMTAEKLAGLAKDDAALAVQAKLYDAAASLVTDNYDKAVAELKSIDRNQLPLGDQQLLDAALDLSVRLHMPPQVSGPITTPPPVSAEQGEDPTFEAMPQTLEKAKTTIGSADALLNGDQK